ncbi:MAG: BatA domain-containing protein [Planctomycetota bacterium]
MFGYSFVNPLFIYAGLGAILAPILIHLLFKAKKQTVIFSSLKFILASTVRKSSRIKFKELLLLLLRVAMFALITLAFTRPFLKSAVGRSLALKGKVDLVLIVDDSYSLRYLMPNGKMIFDDVRQEALSIIGKLRRGDRVAVVRTAGGGDVLTKLTPNFTYAENAVKDMKPSAAACKYSDAVKRAAALLEGSHADHRRIYFISDCQSVSFDLSEIELALKGLGGAIGIDVKDVGLKDAENLAVRDVKAPDWGWMPGQPLTLLVTIVNYSPKARSDVGFHVDVAGQKFPGKVFDYEPGQSREIAVTHTYPEATALNAVVRVEGKDALPIDDEWHIYLKAAKPVKVLCVENSINAIKDFQETIYLRTAMDPRTQEGEAPGYVLPEVIAAQNLADENLTGYEVVVLANVAGLTAQQVERVEAFVQSGGGLMIFLGEDVDYSIYNHLLFKAGLRGLLPCRLKPVEKGNPYWTLGKADMEHYILKPFATKDSGDITLPRFYKRFGVEMPKGPDAEKARVIARFDDDAPALIAHTFGQGKVLLFTSRCFTTAWDPGWTDLPRRMVFVPLVHQMVRYLTGREVKQAEAPKVGETIRIDANALQAEKMVAVKRPDGKIEKLPVDQTGYATLRTVDAPGLYVAWPGTEAQQPSKGYAVNLETFESDLTHATEAQLRKVREIGKGSEDQIATVSRRAELFHGSEDDSGGWRWLLILAFIFMVCELLLANSISK